MHTADATTALQAFPALRLLPFPIKAKSALEIWMIYHEVTFAFESMYLATSVKTLEDAVPLLERFVVLFYDRNDTSIDVNDACNIMFTENGRSVESILPTAAALLEHGRHVVYQVGYTWEQSLNPNPKLPSPSEWGMTQFHTNEREPFWSSLNQASTSRQELLRCGCNPKKVVETSV